MKKKLIFVFLSVALISITSYAQTLNDALRLTDNEQYEAAADVYRALIAKEPTNATYYYYLGDNFLLSENSDSALIAYQSGEKIDANNPLPKIGRAKYNLDKYGVREMKRLSDLAAQGTDKTKAAEAEALYQKALLNVNEAKALIDQAITAAGPKNAEVFIEAADALIHFKNKDLDKAKTLLDKALALQPKNSDILILFGDIYSELNNGTLSADYYNKALELNPKSAKSIVNKGRLYKRCTNYEGAADEFKNAIKVEDAYAPAHRELGEVYFKLNKLDAAKEEYRKYLELSKNNCGARVRYASFLYLSKDYSGALTELAQQKNCDPNNITALRIKTYCSYEVKDSAGALAAAQALFSKIQEDKIIDRDYEYYGKILSLNNQDSLAVDYLRKAYQLDISRCDLLSEIWKIYDKIKNYAQAAQVLEEKMRNCKGFTVTDYFNLGRSYFFSRDFLKADSAFAKVNELTPKYASGWLWRADANSNIDSTSEKGLAKPYYEKYIEVATADTAGMTNGKYKSSLIVAYRYLASYSYLQLKDKEKAKEYIQKALLLDPENKDLQDIIKGFEYEQQKKKK